MDEIVLLFSQELEAMSRKIILRATLLNNRDVREELHTLAMRLSGAAFYVKQEEEKNVPK